MRANYEVRKTMILDVEVEASSEAEAIELAKKSDGWVEAGADYDITNYDVSEYLALQNKWWREKQRREGKKDIRQVRGDDGTTDVEVVRGPYEFKGINYYDVICPEFGECAVMEDDLV